MATPPVQITAESLILAKAGSSVVVPQQSTLPQGTSVATVCPVVGFSGFASVCADKTASGTSLNANGSAGTGTGTGAGAGGTTGSVTGFSGLGNFDVNQLSHHTCNSQYATVSFDMVGNAGITWQDTRDGNWGIYFKALDTKLSGQACTGKIQVGTAAGGTMGVSGLCATGFSGVALSTLYSVDDTQGAGTAGGAGTTDTAVAPTGTGEARVTCLTGSSLFPDTAADTQGRFHLVYENNASGKFDIFYNQVYPAKVGEKKECDNAAISTVGTFGSDAGAGAALPEGKFFTHGDPNMADPVPSKVGDQTEWTGHHRLFRDFQSSTKGSWTGISKAADKDAWIAQGGVWPPPYVSPAGNPRADAGDFGSAQSFTNIAFMTQSPPHNPIEITSVRLPLKPKCVPSPTAGGGTMRTQDLVPAPKRPLPPTFIDPVDISSVLGSPGVSVDNASPSRYTIDGNESTVFTNLLTDGGATQIVFHKTLVGQELKFILGQTKCSDTNCAVKVPGVGSTSKAKKTSKVRLQVWEGGSYLHDDTLAGSETLSATMILEKEFELNPGDDSTRFVFNAGELKARRARLLFFVPISDDFDFYVDGVGGGNAVWSPAGDGTFKQYFVPYTLKPYAGMDAPVYYEGKLLTPNCPETVPPRSGISLSNVTVSVLNAFDYFCSLYPYSYVCTFYAGYYSYLKKYLNFPITFTLNNDSSSRLGYSFGLALTYPNGSSKTIPLTTTGTIAAKSSVTTGTAGQVSDLASASWTGTFLYKLVVTLTPAGASKSTVITVGSGSFTTVASILTQSVPISVSLSEALPSFDEVLQAAQPFGLDYSPKAKNFVVSVNDPTGNPNSLATLSTVVTPAHSATTTQQQWVSSTTATANGYKVITNAGTWVLAEIPVTTTVPESSATVLKPYGTDGDAQIAGLTGDVFIAIAQDEGAGKSRGGFAAGELFADTGKADVIRLDADGKKSATYHLGATGDDSDVARGLCIDRANVVGGDLLVATAKGNIWRIKSDGTLTKMASASAVFEGVASIANDPQYGPFAGRVLACAEAGQKIYAFSPSSATPVIYDMAPFGISPSAISAVVDGENLFSTNLKGFSDGKGSLVGLGAGSLANKTDKILLAEKSGRLSEMSWDKTGSAVKVANIATVSALGQISFSTIGIGTVKAVSTCASSDPDGAVVSTSSSASAGSTAGGTAGGAAGAVGGDISNLMLSPPRQLTASSGNSEHPRLAIDNNNNAWVVFHSDRSGANEAYAARYVGACGKWVSSGQGGSDIKLSDFGPSGQAKFPSAAMDEKGEVHVVFQGTSSDDGHWEIYYTHSLGGGKTFTDPIRLTASPADAMMPDIAITYPGGFRRLTVVWHDNRYGNFEIMAAVYKDGEWASSGQGGSDLRITQTRYDSMFPRIAGDFNSNLRVVYQSSRATDPSNSSVFLPGIYMSSYVASYDGWSSSGQGGSDKAISGAPDGASSSRPDIDIDCQNGPMVVWDDNRGSLDNPTAHEDIFTGYSQRQTDHFGGPHFQAINANRLGGGGGGGGGGGPGPGGGPGGGGTPYKVITTSVVIGERAFAAGDITLKSIDSTETPDISLIITAPGATFWRAANEDGVFSDWVQFNATVDPDTTVVPWRLSCSSGAKRVCVQTQDSQFLGYPVYVTVTLTAKPPTFSIEMFQDANLLKPLPTYRNWSAAKEGEVYVRLTSSKPLTEFPIFDVVSRGLHIVRNQKTIPIPDAAESTTVTSATSDTGKTFANGYRTFRGSFNVYREDGLFHIDGLARLVPHGKDECGNPF